MERSREPRAPKSNAAKKHQQLIIGHLDIDQHERTPNIHLPWDQLIPIITALFGLIQYHLDNTSNVGVLYWAPMVIVEAFGPVSTKGFRVHCRSPSYFAMFQCPIRRRDVETLDMTGDFYRKDH